jgi:hypothetical protein
MNAKHLRHALPVKFDGYISLPDGGVSTNICILGTKKCIFISDNSNSKSFQLDNRRRSGFCRRVYNSTDGCGLPPELNGFLFPRDTEVIYRGRYSDWLQTGRLRVRSSCPGRGKIFLLSTSSRSLLWPTQSPIQLVPEALSPGVKWLRREDDHSQLVSRSRKHGSIHPLPRTSSWHSA